MTDDLTNHLNSDRSRIRVLHLYAGNLYGGIESDLRTLARYRNTVPELDLSFGLCFSGRLKDELQNEGVEVHDLGPVRFSRPWSLFRARRRLRDILSGTKFDAVFTHACWSHAAFAPVVRSARIVSVNWVHDLLTGSKWTERLASWTPPDAALTNSQFTAGPAARLYPRATIAVNYNAVAAPAGFDPAVCRREIRAGFGTPDDTVVILQASRLERWKGHAVHLEALARLKTLPYWEAWFAGGPQKPGEAEYLRELEQSAKRCGIADRVRFLGQRKDVPQLMAAADIYCQPNTRPEPFGVVYIEALYSGLPIIGSAMGGTLEIIQGEYGVLLPAGDIGALADALKGLMQDPAKLRVLGATGPARAAQLCDPQKSLTGMLSCVRAITRN